MGRIWVFGYIVVPWQTHFTYMELHVKGYRVGKFGVSLNEELKMRNWLKMHICAWMVIELKHEAHEFGFNRHFGGLRVFK